MLTIKRERLIGLLIMVFLLAGCGGLSSEPEIVQELVIPTPVPALNTLQTAPSIDRGAVFYADHCAMCHGPSGQGDGEMVLDGRLQNPPPNFAEPIVAQGQTPLDFMQSVTEGNMMSGMPPFSSYTEQERWDAVAYVYTGHVTPEQLTLGVGIFESNCAECHGASGRGTIASAPDFTDPAFWSVRSDVDLFSAVTSGRTGMPDFGGSLSEEERWAAVAYVRTFAIEGEPGFVPSDAPVADAAPTEASSDAPQATTAPPSTEVAEVVVEEAQTITVSGQVVNSTEGSEQPANVGVTLHLFDPPMYTETKIEGVLDDEGGYVFADVEHLTDRIYLLSIEHDGVPFGSTVYQLADGETAIETTLEVFDSTDDPSVVSLVAGIMRITFAPFGMEVAQVYHVQNDSDKIFLTGEEAQEDWQVALRFPLPPGAFGVGFEPGMENTRFLLSDDEMTVYDTQPVRPGQEEIVYTYYVPYQDGAIIEQEVTLNFNGTFHLLVESGQVAVTGEAFESGGEPVDMGGMVFDAYLAELDLSAGDTYSFTVAGTPDIVSESEPATTQTTGGGASPFVVGLIIAGVILLGAGGFIFILQMGGNTPIGQEIDDLLADIADLDDRHDQGDINHDVYQRQRAELKAKVAELMREQQAADGE